MIGWALILEYTIGGSAVARGISPNLALFFGGPDSLPWILARHELPWLDVVVDPCAAVLVFVVTALLCVGIKESSFVQGVVTVLNCFVMLFVIIAGSYIGFQTGWVGYKVAGGFFPYGVNGMLAGSATVFFAYIGFDSVASTAEEVRKGRISQIDLAPCMFAGSVASRGNENSFYLLTGEESATRSAIGNRNSIVNLLFLVHVGFSCYRWSGTILCYGPRYPNFICL